MSDEMTFWDHLEALRMTLLRIGAVVVVVSILVFAMKDTLFTVMLAPCTSDFLTYRVVGAEPFALHLMNTGLTEQFFIHVRTALCVGLLVASPWVLLEVFRFVSPALHAGERGNVIRLTAFGYVMFVVGVLVSYFVIFPLTVRFLGTYQVSEQVDNMLTLQSYIDTMLSLTLMMGVVFELPVVCALLSRMGLIDRQMMRALRRHALVAVLVVSAIITPTGDAVTLLVVAMPVYLLYEGSILVVRDRSRGGRRLRS